MPIRIPKVEPRGVPPRLAAHRLGFDIKTFDIHREELLTQGSPPPDPTTDNYELVAIHAWMKACSDLSSEALTDLAKKRDAEVFAARPTAEGKASAMQLNDAWDRWRRGLPAAGPVRLAARYSQGSIGGAYLPVTRLCAFNSFSLPLGLDALPSPFSAYWAPGAANLEASDE